MKTLVFLFCLVIFYFVSIGNSASLKNEEDKERNGSMIDQIVMDLLPDKSGYDAALHSTLFNSNLSTYADLRGKRSDKDDLQLHSVVNLDSSPSNIKSLNQEFDLSKLADSVKYNVDLGVTGLSKAQAKISNDSSLNSRKLESSQLNTTDGIQNKTTSKNRKKYNQTELVLALKNLISKPKTFNAAPSVKTMNTFSPSTMPISTNDGSSLNSNQIDSYKMSSGHPRTDNDMGSTISLGGTSVLFNDHSGKESVELATKSIAGESDRSMPTTKGNLPTMEYTEKSPFTKQPLATAFTTMKPTTSVTKPSLGQTTKTPHNVTTKPMLPPTTTHLTTAHTEKSTTSHDHKDHSLATTKYPATTSTKLPESTTKPSVETTTNSTNVKPKKSSAMTASPIFLSTLILPVVLSLL